jgi:hypothetical protein
MCHYSIVLRLLANPSPPRLRSRNKSNNLIRSIERKFAHREDTSHCTRHTGPERDIPETPGRSELMTPPLVVGYTVGGGTQAREAEQR